MPYLRAPVSFVLLMVSTIAGSAPATSTNAQSMRPGDDFYSYANASWLSSVSLPAREQSFGPTAMLKALNSERVRKLIEEAAVPFKRKRDPTVRKLQQVVGDFYTSVADRNAIERLRLSRLRRELDAIAAISDRRSLSEELGRTLRLDDGSNTSTEGIFGIWIHQGFDDADHYLPHLVQGGLGLSSADSYLSGENAELARYRAHVARVLKLTGSHHPQLPDQVISLEAAIARTHASRADTDDPAKVNNRWTNAEFAVKAPGLDWVAYFRTAGLSRQRQSLVWQPSAVRGTSALVASRPLAAWKAYLTVHLIDHYAAVLPERFSDPQAVTTRDARSAARALTEASLGEPIGRLYVGQFFPPKSKAVAMDMAANLRGAFRGRIENLAWMSPATRSKALLKLDALRIGVGYPDRWTDYSSLQIKRDDALGNLRRLERFALARAIAKLDDPVDPGEWSALVPQVPGAVINFSPNAIQFSAGILQPPYFDPNGDAASNYGSAGAGMAHEISHSFDQLGNLYDARGRFGNWWSEVDVANYQTALAPLAQQFGALCPRPAMCLDGHRLLGENAADLAGLRVALDAYRLSLHGRPDRMVGGLTGDQRFFLAFARRWQKVQTDAALQHDVETDIHAPGRYRSNTVRNVDEWYSAFGVRPTDALYLAPANRIRIW